MYDMKTLTYTSAIILAVASTGAFAHHPSEGVSPSFDRVEDQLEAAESPHLDMDMDAMGATAAAGASDMSTEAREQAGWVSNQAGVEIPDVEPPMDAAESADTMGLLE
jgi:hypothetical protein